MNHEDERNLSSGPEVTSFDEHRRRRDDDRQLAQRVLSRATDGADASIDGMLESVPRMMDEARRRRERAGRRDALTASIPMARTAIPRLAAVAAVLLAVSLALLLTGSQSATTSTTSLEDVLIAGNGVSDEMIVESIIGPEVQP